jgi:hypothetical protein
MSILPLTRCVRTSDSGIWFVIPEEEVQGMENISLHTETSRANDETYREA